MITVEDVEHVAKLARLAFSEQEKQLYAEQLARIIDYFDQLKSVDTTGVEPLAHALSLVNVMREDEVIAPPGWEVLLKNAPDQEKGLFRVPRIGE
jgi:aspartyl-tRNA(Asn)/glutamyl-tRNA(Gln) amidotransferase subunit C